MVNQIDGARFCDMVIGAAALLENNKDTLNALNVFPVPDGDTGTNMSLTMLSAAKEVSAAKTGDYSAVVSALSMGALKGARGNSGVILSQIWRGFCDVLKQKEDRTVDTSVFAQALKNGVDCAYKAIMKPKEGTILTVAKVMADSASACAELHMSIDEMLVRVIEDADTTLKKTPDMLPVLKEAGVVDAGGAGLLIILKGFKMVLDGEDFEKIEGFDMQNGISIENTAINEDIEFGYCTEFFIKNLFDYVEDRDIDSFRTNIAKLGDSVIVVGDLELVKVHVHTNDPGIILQDALTLGMLSQIKIDNMREQHRELINIEEPEPVKKQSIAVVSVVSGDGLKKSFADCAVDTFVEGGQTMNPSADDILKAIEKAPSDNVFVLPNNKNIVLAAEQAAELSPKNVVVIPSRSLPQGLSAVLNYNCTDSFEENFGRMKEAIEYVKTGQVTYAVRDTSINGMEIKEGENIGIGEGEILSCGSDMNVVSLQMLEKLCDDDSAVISMFYGDDITEQDALSLKEMIAEKFDWCDVEFSYGGQAVYSYIFSVE